MRCQLVAIISSMAGATDGLDGLLARRFDQRSQLGTILDPIADKMMMVTSFVVLSMRSIFPQPVPSHLPIPFWVTIAVISRDVFILVGAASINIVTGFRGFRPSMLGKINTTVQIVAIAVIMQHEFERFFEYLQTHAEELTNFEVPAEGTSDALVRVTRTAALRRRVRS